MSCWQLSWFYRNGNIGLRVRSTHLSSGLTTRTYILSARRLNSHQAQWALFLVQFNFSLTYHSGSQNGKPDALSCQFSPASADSEQEMIIAPTCVVGAALWRMEQEVQEALRDVPVPGQCPPNCLFVPQNFHSSVLQWGHASKEACHPGLR